MLTMLLFAAAVSVEDFEHMDLRGISIFILRNGGLQTTIQSQSEEGRQRMLDHMLNLLDIHKSEPLYRLVDIAKQITILWPERREEVLIKIFSALNHLDQNEIRGFELINLYEFIKAQPLSDSEWISLVPYFPNKDVIDNIFLPELKRFFAEIQRKKALIEG